MNSCAKSMRVGILDAGRRDIRDILQGTSAKSLCVARLETMSAGLPYRLPSRISRPLAERCRRRAKLKGVTFLTPAMCRDSNRDLVYLTIFTE